MDAANAASAGDRSVAMLAVEGASSWNMTLECLDDLVDRDLCLTGVVVEGAVSSVLSGKGASPWNMTLACLDERESVLLGRGLGLGEGFGGGFASSVLLELSEWWSSSSPSSSLVSGRVLSASSAAWRNASKNGNIADSSAASRRLGWLGAVSSAA